MEAHRQRDVLCELVVESCRAHREGEGNDFLYVSLRNIGRSDAVAVGGSVFIPPAWYRPKSPAPTVAPGQSAELLYELPMGTVVRRGAETDHQGGFRRKAEWDLPSTTRLELELTDGSGPRRVDLLLRDAARQ